MRMKVLYLMSMLLFCIVPLAFAPPLPWETPATVLWYMRGDTHTVNYQLGYVLNTTQSTSYVEQSISDTVAIPIYQTTYIGFRLWLRNPTNQTEELTGGSPESVINRTSAGSGIQSTTYVMPLTDLGRNEAIIARVYLRIGSGSWSEQALFISPQLDYRDISNSTWTVYYWTARDESDNGTHYTTTNRFRYGDGTHNSRINNIQFVQFSPWEEQQDDLQEGDFLVFLFYPWVYWIGNIFWGFIVLFIDVTLYNKYEDVRIPLVFTWMFGSAGGVITLMIPAAALHISWFFIAFALASTLYLMIR